MKKILVPYQREEFIKFCDKHPTRPCNGNIWLTFGHPSQYDEKEMNLDMCDECASKLIEYLKTEFKDKAILIYSKL